MTSEFMKARCEPSIKKDIAGAELCHNSQVGCFERRADGPMRQLIDFGSRVGVDGDDGSGKVMVANRSGRKLYGESESPGEAPAAQSGIPAQTGRSYTGILNGDRGVDLATRTKAGGQACPQP